MTLRERLEPYGLPDSGRGRVEDSVRFVLPALFAARQASVARGVVRAHDQLVVAGAHDGGDLRAEGRVTALVLRNFSAVDPDRRLVVDRTEMQPDALTLRSLEPTHVPDGVVKTR